jgi:hypothetical protein
MIDSTARLNDGTLRARDDQKRQPVSILLPKPLDGLTCAPRAEAFLGWRANCNLSGALVLDLLVDIERLTYPS